MTTALSLRAIDLPGLQNRLDGLAVGERLAVSGPTIQRLFGVNHIASERVEHFAVGHGCIAKAQDDSIVFYKARITGS